MKLLLSYFITLSVIIGLTNISNGAQKKNQGSQNVPADEIVPNIIVVKFKEDPKIKTTGIQSVNPVVNKLINDHQITFLKKVFGERNLSKISPGQTIYPGIYKARYTGEKLPPEVAASISKLPEVEYAEPLYIHHINEIPNDTLINEQLVYYNVIEVPAAWEVFKGEEGDALIAIVDGGTDIRHPDLADNIWSNDGETPDNQIDDDGNGYIDDMYGWNFANDSGDPTGLASTPSNADHGTHTAGIAGGVSNNLRGVAGVSWNAKIMGINVGDENSDRSIRYGYDGIVYAADNGAQIISCSWGRQGSYSQFEQDIIDYVTSLGALVVAAAGNNNNALAHYPSSYRNVLSIAGTDADDDKYSLSNYGSDIDMSAPGVQILSTFPDRQYGYATGTSMSTPMAAGVIGLVKSQNPDWTGIQAGEQVRVTTDSIDAYQGELGRGRLNAYRAVTESSPSIRISDYSFADENDNGIIEPGEQVELEVTMINYISTANNVELVLTSTDPYVTIIDGSEILTSMPMLQPITISSPFVIQIATNTPGAYPVDLKINIHTAGYRDHDRFSLLVLPYFADLDINNILATVTNIGRIGQLNPAPPSGNIGFVYKSGNSLLYEGALIAGISETKISNAARGISAEDDQDFTGEPGGDMTVHTPGELSDQESRGIFNDYSNPASMNLHITQSTYAWSDSANQDYLILNYLIRNTGNEDLNTFYMGFFFDWDIDEGSYDTNMAGYDPIRKMGTVFDTGDGPATHVGVIALSDETVSYRAIYNDHLHQDNPSWGIHDGFTDLKKWEAISGGITYTEAGPADISFVLANGPISIPAKSHHRLAFALVAADDSASLTVHADSVIAMSERLIITDLEREETQPAIKSYALFPNYPNPFNPQTRIGFQLKKAGDVSIMIYDIRGRRIRTLMNRQMNTGIFEVVWDGKNSDGKEVASGTYFYRIKSGEFTRTRKMQLLR